MDLNEAERYARARVTQAHALTVKYAQPEAAFAALLAELDRLRAGVPAQDAALCGSWPLGWTQGGGISCVLPRGHNNEDCQSNLGGQWRRSPERTPTF